MFLVKIGVLLQFKISILLRGPFFSKTAQMCYLEQSGESFSDKDGALRRGRGRGRGGRGRGRGQHHSNNRGGGLAFGTPPSTHLNHPERDQSVVAIKQPPGPRMPDGTRGFTMGRGKPVAPAGAV